MQQATATKAAVDGENNRSAGTAAQGAGAAEAPAAPAEAEQERLVAELTAHADDPPDRTGQPRKLTPATLLLLALSGAGAAIAAAKIYQPTGAAMVAALSGLFALMSLYEDLLLPSPRSRKTAEAAALCFAKALKRNRWTNAYACHHPGTLSSPVMLPSIPQLGVSGGDGSLATLKDFRRYWRALLRGGGLQQRTCMEASVGAVISHATDKNRATGMVFLTVARVSVLALGLGKTAEAMTRREVALTFRVSMFRYKSQWWLLPLAFQNDRVEVLQ